MCGAMRNIAQYLNVYLANTTRDLTNPWDCVLSPYCTNITCTSKNMTTSFVLNPCRRMLTLYLVSPSLDVASQRVINVTRSGSVSLDNTTILNNQLAYNTTRKTLGIQVGTRESKTNL